MAATSVRLFVKRCYYLDTIISSTELANNQENKLHAFPVWVVEVQPLSRSIYMLYTISRVVELGFTTHHCSLRKYIISCVPPSTILALTSCLKSFFTSYRSHSKSNLELNRLTWPICFLVFMKSFQELCMYYVMPAYN